MSNHNPKNFFSGRKKKKRKEVSQKQRKEKERVSLSSLFSCIL
jgi:hypothetical protein